MIVRDVSLQLGGRGLTDGYPYVDDLNNAATFILASFRTPLTAPADPVLTYRKPLFQSVKVARTICDDNNEEDGEDGEVKSPVRSDDEGADLSTFEPQQSFCHCCLDNR